jgi:hypothetical protein
VTKPTIGIADERLWVMARRLLIVLDFALGAVAAVLAYDWLQP